MAKFLFCCLCLIYGISAKGQEIYDFQPDWEELDFSLGIAINGFVIQDDNPDFVYQKYKGIKKIEEQRWLFNPDSTILLIAWKGVSNNKQRNSITKTAIFSSNSLPVSTEVFQNVGEECTDNFFSFSEELAAASADSAVLIYKVLVSTRSLHNRDPYAVFEIIWYKRVDRDKLKRTSRIRWIAPEIYHQKPVLFLDTLLWAESKYIDFGECDFAYPDRYISNLWHTNYAYMWLGKNTILDAFEKVPYSDFELLPCAFHALYRKAYMPSDAMARLEFRYEYTDTNTIEYCYMNHLYKTNTILRRVRYFDAQKNETMRVICADDKKDTIHYHYNSAGDLIKIDMRQARMPINVVSQKYYPNNPPSPDDLYPSYLHEVFVRQEPINWYTFNNNDIKIQEFEYLSFDERGNWTMRMVKNSLFPYQFRRLEYYD
jgi:hypothetical protein